MNKIKDQLAGVAALIGVLAAIGGGFVKYGEIITKLEALEGQESLDYSAQIAVLEEKVTALENMDTSHTHDMKHTHENTQVKINETEIKLLKNSIEELKASSSNPLAN